MDAAANILLEYLYQVMDDSEHAALDLQQLPDEFHMFAKELSFFCNCVQETRNLAKSLSKGNLDVMLPAPGNQIAAPLKALHATLKHLAWQTQQVAKGDYRHRIDFMGDFAKAFNAMTEQLEHQRAALLKEIESCQSEIYSLMQNKVLYDLLAGHMTQWMIVMDADTTEWLFASRQADEVLAEPNCRQQFSRWLLREAENIGAKDEIQTTELELAGCCGVQYYSVSIHPLHWHDRNALIFMLTDVSKERERLHYLQNIANYDTLTQAYNRRYGMEILAEWISQKKSFILGFVDIDNLKYVNDHYGHSEGDRYILRTAAILREFSSHAIISRIGGDEFILLVQNFTLESATEQMEMLRGCLAGYKNELSHIAYENSISYGVIAVDEKNTLCANELLNVVDEKMYQYKRAYKLCGRGK